MSEKIVILTSQENWLTRLAEAYKNHQPVILIDDAQLGINPEDETLFAMGKQGKLNQKEWIAVLVVLGGNAAGIWLVNIALKFPEQRVKVILVVGGIALIATFNFTAIRGLAGWKPPNVTAERNNEGLLTFTINWDKNV